MNFQSPKGEFVVMNYRVSKNVRVPFVMMYSVNEVGNKVEVVVKVTKGVKKGVIDRFNVCW